MTARRSRPSLLPSLYRGPHDALVNCAVTRPVAKISTPLTTTSLTRSSSPIGAVIRHDLSISIVA